MALTASRMRLPRFSDDNAPDPIVADLPRLADDPEVIRLSERKATLRRAYDARKAQLEIRAIDNEFARGTGSQHGPRADLIRERRATLLASLPQPTNAQPLPDDADLHPAVAGALRLVRGEKVPAPMDDAAEVARLMDEMNVLNAAMRQVDLEMDEVREDRSAAIARSLLPQHNAILQSKWAAAAALSQATAAERRLVAQMIQAGYTMQPGILLSPRLAEANTLGDLSRADSPVSLYRDALQVAGVLP